MPEHIPVLLEETVEGLDVRPGGVFIDATLGAGGHARAILERSSPGGRLLGIDRDPLALETAAGVLEEFGERLVAARGNFSDLGTIARERGFERVDGVLMDLGFSSLQIDSARRGFSFRLQAPLDMRMDPSQGLTARDVVNRASKEELARIFRELGEERRAGRIAVAIIRERSGKPIETTTGLAAVVASAVGRSGGRIHPATRVFQALRMHVNRELENLEAALPAAVGLLRPGGRLAVLTYHSLEDRLVKQTLRRLSGRCSCPPRDPVCTCGATPLVVPVTRKPVGPSRAEVLRNRRARSAKLRVVEKLGEAA